MTTLFLLYMARKAFDRALVSTAGVLACLLVLSGCQLKNLDWDTSVAEHPAPSQASSTETPSPASDKNGFPTTAAGESSDPFLAMNNTKQTTLARSRPETPPVPVTVPETASPFPEQSESITQIAPPAENPEGRVLLTGTPRQTEPSRQEAQPFPTGRVPTEKPRQPERSAIQQVAFFDTPADESPRNSVLSDTSSPAATSTVSYEREARVPLQNEAACPDGSCPLISSALGVVPFDPTKYPDEYLCDGGDRGYPFHYEGTERAGLETEDTVAEYFDTQGKRHVKPSSRVCIYAPRFAAVRSMSASLVNRDVRFATGAHDQLRSAGFDTRLAISKEAQHTYMDQLDRRSRASGIEAQAIDFDLTHLKAAAGHQDLFAAYQNLSFVTTGRFRQADSAILAYGAQAAGVWSRDHNPVIVAKDVRGAEYRNRFQANETIGIEDRGTPGDLRIVKLADKDVAMPGDVIKFTIRFDNLGQQDLLGVKIVDNLTSRLRYVDRSADSSRTGDLNIDLNGEGSEILEFVFDKPLKGGEGGVITFECEVR